MEVISLNVKIIGRSHGMSAIHKAAYCARDKLYSDYTGKTYDYSKRQDLVYHEVLLPDHAPTDFRYAEILWNSVEKIEKSKNSQLAREIIAALPKELEHRLQIEMVRKYTKEQFVNRGMCADLSIHDKGDGNPHVHILLTTRSLDQDGKWMKKQEKNKMYDCRQQKYIFGKSFKTNNWDDRGNVEKWRKSWAESCTWFCKRQGIDREFTHKSYARQGLNREPTKHLGAKVKSLESQGKFTDRLLENERIRQRNREREFQRLRERSLDRSYDYDRSR